MFWRPNNPSNLTNGLAATDPPQNTQQTMMDDTVCPCHSSAPYLCRPCVRRGLAASATAHQAAVAQHANVGTHCAQQLNRLAHQLGALEVESAALRERWADLQQQSSTLALHVARQAVALEERQAQLVDRRRREDDLDRLHRLDASLSSAMTAAEEAAQTMVRRLRYQWAVEAMVMHRLDVDEPDEKDRRNLAHGRLKHARGIGKIGGLPLPHAGPELFGVLPPLELQSALRLVASVTQLVAQCLGILLPHPILLRLGNSATDIAADESLAVRTSPPSKPTPKPSSPALASSTSSLASLILSKSVFGRVTRPCPVLEETAHQMIVPPSMDPTLVQRRIQHARCAILAEDASNHSSLYALSDAVMAEDEFATALQLLQNNLVALCIRAGVAVDQLWPAEAVLLNLHALYRHCQAQVEAVENGTT